MQKKWRKKCNKFLRAKKSETIFCRLKKKIILNFTKNVTIVISNNFCTLSGMIIHTSAASETGVF